ncbi:MAG TPA: hypothetical protein VH437_03100 [Terriglobales bacterium]|jgi:hypothetical protein
MSPHLQRRPKTLAPKQEQFTQSIDVPRKIQFPHVAVDGICEWNVGLCNYWRAAFLLATASRNAMGNLVLWVHCRVRNNSPIEAVRGSRKKLVAIARGDGTGGKHRALHACRLKLRFSRWELLHVLDAMMLAVTSAARSQSTLRIRSKKCDRGDKAGRKQQQYGSPASHGQSFPAAV